LPSNSNYDIDPEMKKIQDGIRVRIGIDSTDEDIVPYAIEIYDPETKDSEIDKTFDPF